MGADPRLKVAVYLVGTILLGWLIHHIVSETLNPRPPGELRVSTFVWSVLAVSWDALATGPGKVVIPEHFPGVLAAAMSFLIVGAVVGGAVDFVGRLLAIERVPCADWSRERSLVAGYVAQIALFSFFLSWTAIDAVAAYLEQGPPNLLFAMAGALVLAGVILSLTYRRVCDVHRTG